MDARYDQEQQLLADAARGLAADLAVASADDVIDPARAERQWAAVVELGLPSLRSPELSGVDASGVEVAIIVEVLAATLAAVPAVGQGVIVPELLAAAGATAAAESVATGTLRLAPALTADLLGWAGADDEAVAIDSLGASAAVAVVQVDGGRRLVARALDPLAMPALDLTRQVHRVAPAAEAAADGLDLGGVIEDQRWRTVEATALVAWSADLVGVMAGALDDAVAYAADRKQFGTPIGSFQAVQHLLADAHVRLEGARSCLAHAAWALGRVPADEALMAARIAKAYAGDAARDVVETAIQVLGGIGITWEALAHLRLRRALLGRTVLGDPESLHVAIADDRLGAA